MISRGPFQHKWLCDTCAWLSETTATSVAAALRSHSVLPLLDLIFLAVECFFFVCLSFWLVLLLARIIDHLLTSLPNLFTVLGLGSTSNGALFTFGWNTIEKSAYRVSCSSRWWAEALGCPVVGHLPKKFPAKFLSFPCCPWTILVKIKTSWSHRLALEYFLVRAGLAGLRTFCVVLLCLANSNHSTARWQFFLIFVKHCLVYIVLLLPSPDGALALLNQSRFLSEC